ncbi:MAG: phytanoyl-CoA dioxygenase family protein [Acetobacteraceae bacterium]
MGGTVSATNDSLNSWHDVVLQEALPLRNIGPFAPDQIFFGEARSEAAFGGEAGLVQGPSFKPDELEWIRHLIKAHLIENAHAVSPDAASAIADTSLDQYHRVAPERDHGKLLSKLGRVLPEAAVDQIRQMSFFDYVRDAFGPFYLSDEENIGHEQICFRIVRPNRREDVGSLHRDSWFWDYFSFPVPEGESRAKVWVPVCGEPDQAGLLLAPGSHRKHTGYRTETNDGKLAFLPMIEDGQLDLRKFRGNPGDPVMFNYDVLHVGAMTRGDVSRVSFEITIMFNTERA